MQPASSPPPLAYFITFRTYGTWLHGDDNWSIDDRRNLPGQPALGNMPGLAKYEREQLKHPPTVMSHEQRQLVDHAVRGVCEHRAWRLLALNVRTNHVHVVVQGEDSPEKMMGDFKRWATRRLREAAMMSAETNVWAVHGSTRWLWRPEEVAEKVDYVLNGQ